MPLRNAVLALVIPLVALASSAAHVGSGSWDGTLSADCNRPLPDPITHVAVPGQPFQALPSRDGCWIFVSLIQTDTLPNAIAVIQRLSRQLILRRAVPVPGGPGGMALTRDGRVLVAAAGDTILFLDARALASGDETPILGISASETAGAGRVYASITPDDRFLFVSDERQRTITVVNLAKARASRFATVPIVGKIPVGTSPIALTFSADGRWLFTTSQVAPEELHWPVSCKPPTTTNADAVPDRSRGAVIVVDVAVAIVHPESSVVSVVPAGCSPVRLALSPAGTTAYVTARADNNVLIFDADRLVTDGAHSQPIAVPVGTAPVGVAVIDSGRKVVVTNSNRFAGGADDVQFLSVIDAARVGYGAAAVIGRIPAGAFPRELRLTSDERTLLLTNYASRTVDVIDLDRLPMEKVAPPGR